MSSGHNCTPGGRRPRPVLQPERRGHPHRGPGPPAGGTLFLPAPWWDGCLAERRWRTRPAGCSSVAPQQPLRTRVQKVITTAAPRRAARSLAGPSAVRRRAPSSGRLGPAESARPTSAPVQLALKRIIFSDAGWAVAARLHAAFSGSLRAWSSRRAASAARTPSSPSPGAIVVARSATRARLCLL